MTVRVPRELRELYEQLDSKLGLGYTSFAEFVKEAIRKRIEDVRLSYLKTKP